MVFTCEKNIVGSRVYVYLRRLCSIERRRLFYESPSNSYASSNNEVYQRAEALRTQAYATF